MRKVVSKGWALLNSTHPIPSLAVATFVTLFSMGIGTTLGRSFLIGFTVLLQQFSVGLSNDWLDYKRDLASSRKDKPAVRGLISAAAIRNASLAAAVSAQAVAFVFGWQAALIMTLMLLAGWSYNLGMKSNWSSFVPYAVGFGLLPIFAGLSAEDAFGVPGWVIAAAALLGVSAHFANALPDMFDDQKTGVRALPHLLGQRVSSGVISATALVATVLIVAQSENLPLLFATTGLIATIALVGAASFLSLRKRPPRAVFTLLLAASFVNVLLLMLGAG
ncbi:MAG: hypothetical protein RLZZ610_925 [Actinomycetota bacterium]